MNTRSDDYSRWWDGRNSSRRHPETYTDLSGIELTVSAATFSPSPALTHSPTLVLSHLPACLSGKRVLDLGTGCGILAIAAALRGACHVMAVDVNPVALADATANVSKLETAGRLARGVVTVRESDLFEQVPERFDYVIANLPIATMAESWKRLATPSTDIVRRCIRALPAHLSDGGVALFTWASFGLEDPIPSALREAGLACNTLAEETFGALWSLHQATKPSVAAY